MINKTMENENSLSSWSGDNLSCPNGMANISETVYTNYTLPPDLAVPLYGFALPVIVLLTAVANTLIVAVLAQKHMRTPTNILLMAISLSDLMTLLTPAPIFFYMYTLGHYKSPIYPISLCYTWYLFFDILPNTFHTASIWLTLALGVQRYIYVCHPPLARLYCNIPRVIKVVFIILLTAILHQGIRFMEFKYEESCVLYDNDVVPACNIYITKFIGNNLNFYYASYFLFRVFFVHLGPCTILIILNVLLFIALRQAEIKRKKLLRENRKKECLKLRDSNCTTMMLIVILTVFLITEIPLAIITLLHILSSQGSIVLFTNNEYYIIKKYFIVSNFFITISYPINFAIYCGMSRQFLETFRDTFLHRSLKGRDKTSNVSYPTSHRSSVTAISLRMKPSSASSNPCCITSRNETHPSPELSCKEDCDNQFEPQQIRSKGSLERNSDKFITRSVSFAIEDLSKSQDDQLTIQDTKMLDQELTQMNFADGQGTVNGLSNLGFHETVL